MSSTAAWSYTNTAKVKPLIGFDQWTQEITYGEEYEIACTWTAKSEQMTDADGKEFVSRHEIFTEDARPKYLDMIRLKGHSNWEKIRSKTEWDMSPFGEAPDYKVVT